MRIDNISLLNYRQYRNCEFSFGKAANKNIHVIVGRNSAGKTNLLNAINWALYGEEPSLSQQSAPLPTPNLFVLTNSGGKDVKTTVAIGFSNDKGERITVERSAYFQLDRPRTADSELLVIQHSNRGDKILKNIDAQNFVYRIVPWKIRDYFFFDGERLDKFFRESVGERVRDAIQQISQLDYLIEVLKHLDAKITELRSSIKSGNPRVQQTRDQLDHKEEDLAVLQSNLSQARKNKNEANKQYESIAQQLRGLDEVRKHQANRERLAEQIRSLEENRTSYEATLVETLPVLVRYAGAASSIDWYLEQVKALIKLGKIPPTFDKSFLQGLLDKHECICGQKLDQGSEGWLRIQTVLLDNPYSNLSNDMQSDSFYLRELRKNVIVGLHKYEEARKAIAMCDQDQIQNKIQLDKVNEEIERLGGDGTDIQALDQQYRRYSDIREREDKKIGAWEYRAQQLSQEISGLRKDLDDELRKEKRFEKIATKLRCCARAREIANKTIQDIMDDLRREMELHTEQEFFRLIWRKDTYQNVQINDGYKVSVIRKTDGYDGLGGLSAGERELLALSFVGALHLVSGFDAPLVIDTPLAKIDGDNRISFAETIPILTGAKQIILLMTDQEYTDEVKSVLEKHLVDGFKLNVNEAEQEVRLARL